MNHILNWCLPFLMKSPLLCLFGTLFGHFSYSTSINDSLLNWIIFWIESAELFLNRIISWIESWVKQYWIEYWINRFFGKIQTLNWIRLGIGHHYRPTRAKKYVKRQKRKFLDLNTCFLSEFSSAEMILPKAPSVIGWGKIH